MGNFVGEISKDTQYSVAALTKQVMEHKMLLDHPLQRQSGQWMNDMKGNLIATVLHQFPIPSLIVAEQFNGTMPIHWLLDGKQRTTTLMDYKRGAFKVSKKIERPIISYASTVKDENGNVVLEGGIPKYENAEFDIRGKFYDDLPDELKDIFDNYTVHIVMYLNCSDEDLEYHIRRYNAAKPMSASQKGITHLGRELARVCKMIAKSDFFIDNGHYTNSEKTNGTLERVVTESVMAINFLSDWHKKNTDICEYLKEHATSQQFDEFESYMDRLDEVVDYRTCDMFNSKNSFLWFALFDRFNKYSKDDEQFTEFLVAFKNGLNTKKIDGKAFTYWDDKSTKDKNIVIDKLDFLEKLLADFLGVKKIESVELTLNASYADYVDDFMDSDYAKVLDINPETEAIRLSIQSLMLLDKKFDLSDKAIVEYMSVPCDIELFGDVLFNISVLYDWTLSINATSKLASAKYLPALIAMTSYIGDVTTEDEIAIGWLTKFSEEFDLLEVDSVASLYKMMVSNFDNYMSYVSLGK